MPPYLLPLTFGYDGETRLYFTFLLGSQTLFRVECDGGSGGIRCVMPELTASTDQSIGMIFVDREQTPRELMELSIQLQLYESSLWILFYLRVLQVERAHSTVHKWVQKADGPTDGAQFDHIIALDETAIHLDDQRDWLYAAVDPETNKFLHVRLFLMRNEGVTSIFL